MASSNPSIIFKRADGCPNGWFRSGDWCYEIWSNVVRWVILVVCLLIGLFLVCCVIARRRKSRGMTPLRGTGWMAGPGHPGQPQYQYNQHQNPTDYYMADQQQQQQPQQQPPPYPPAGYPAPPYGAQQPQNVYQPPEGPPPQNVYQSPEGPPPQNMYQHSEGPPPGK